MIIQTRALGKRRCVCQSAKSQPERRGGSARVPGHAFFAWRSSWRMVVYIYYTIADGNSIISQLGSTRQGNRYGTKTAGGTARPSRTKSHLPGHSPSDGQAGRRIRPALSLYWSQQLSQCTETRFWKNLMNRGWGPRIFLYIFFPDVSYLPSIPFFCYSVLCWWYHHSPLPRVYKENNEREANLYIFPVEGSSSEFPLQKCFACLVRTKHICYSYRHIQFAVNSAPNERAFRYKSAAKEIVL